ncbi:MAG: hypothetical protein ACRDIC_07395, partial [bacterium]
MDTVIHPRAGEAQAGARVLASLLEGLAAGRVDIVELGATLNEKTPIIQLPPPLANTPGFKKHAISEY